MRLTSFTDYSLRVLVYLAVSGEEQVTIREISQRYGVSRNHLMKVVQALSQKGYLIALRGKNGGLRLKISPAEINVGTLVREMENDLVLAECLGDNNQCILTPACKLKFVLSEALNAFFEVLDAYTLEDMLPEGKRTELISILQLG
jgi:Rrf2 family nitric oxide-sensitive transcriptional repressor